MPKFKIRGSAISGFLFPVLAISSLVIILLSCSGSWLIARKVIALLILPAGAIWMVLLAFVCWPKISLLKRVGFAALWIVYSLAGSPYVGTALLRPLEAPYFSSEALGENLDALVLLGGGTLRSPGGNPAVGNHGDRILQPAIRYHRGKVRNLITTGRSVTEKGADRLLSRETSLLWQDLGVPESAIIELSEPRNTSEELAAVSELLATHPDWKKIGLCSSASHLNRAFKEAEKHGLDLIPVPCDFRSMPLAFSAHYLVPQGRGFRDVQSALWEYLGGLF